MQESINIREYIDIFKRRKLVVIFILVAFLIMGVYKTYQSNKYYVPIYQSTVSVRINNLKAYNKSNEDNQENMQYYGNSLSNSSLNQNIATSYSSLATSKRAMLEIIKKLDLDTTPEALAGQISVIPQEQIPEFIDITVTDTDAELARKIAAEVPNAFNKELIKVIGLDCVEKLFEASESTVVPRVMNNSIPKYGLIGLVLAIFIVLLLECLDNKIVTPDDVEEYWGVPLAGMIPYDNGKGIGRVKTEVNRIKPKRGVQHG